MDKVSSVDDLVLRVPQRNRKELALLANIGALNSLDGVEHRRDALWQVERAGRPEGPLLMQQSQWLHEETSESPLAAMTPEERMVADYAVTSVTTGPHPMWFRRQELHRKGYLRAADLASRPDGAWVKTAGLAFVKQRPGTASGVVFIKLSIRDNGTGMDEQMAGGGRSDHWGLQGMRERAHLAGGKLSIRSRPCVGTEVELLIPGKLAYPLRQRGIRRYVCSDRQWVIVVDTPPLLGENMRLAIAEVTNEPVTHFIYSHWTRIILAPPASGDQASSISAITTTRDHLLRWPDSSPAPTETFETQTTLDVNGVKLELSYKGQNHCEGNKFLAGICMPMPMRTQVPEDSGPIAPTCSGDRLIALRSLSRR